MSDEGKRRYFKVDRSSINPNVPLFSYFQGQRLGYVEARKCMYVKWYWKLCQETEAFKYLKKRFDSGISLNLLEYDGLPRPSADELPEQLTEARLREILDDEKQIFGMVLACALLGFKPWKVPT
eukprot:TRINITY_DN3706_c0_g1_i10.p2 TRINITY_DN3706_c0_g1~~TRINITY_DN3706_c0_g1_i10.p2  ORF type:complete len:124 (-),score=20.69 TRINITY_DN3706_c0_g1_i10:99-470(-)